MTLSIVILTLNSENNILKCLNAIQTACTKYTFEIIIIDNGSVDSTIRLIESNHGDCILIRNKQNKGVAKARNQGIKIAKGEYLLILDDDVVMHPLSLDKLVDIISNDKKAGIVAPQLLNPDGSVQFNGLPLPSIKIKTQRIFCKLIGRNISNPYADAITNKETYEPGYVIGAVQLIRTVLIEKVGLLDEKIFYGPEDADFCYRISQCQFKILCVPQVNMTHNYQRRSYKFKQLPLLLKHLQSLAYFWIKHRKM